MLRYGILEKGKTISVYKTVFHIKVMLNLL